VRLETAECPLGRTSAASDETERDTVPLWNTSQHLVTSRIALGSIGGNLFGFFHLCSGNSFTDWATLESLKIPSPAQMETLR
jgi:hypothetical protein